MKAFVCHSSDDSEFVVNAVQRLKGYFDELFFYEESQRSDESFITTINRNLEKCEVMLVFVGGRLSQFQIDEVNAAYHISSRRGKALSFFFVFLPGSQNDWPNQLQILSSFPCLRLKSNENDDVNVDEVEEFVVKMLENQRASTDGLPRNPQIFRYEKDIIDYFINRVITQGNRVVGYGGKKWLEGCPDSWPQVVNVADEEGEAGNSNVVLEEDDVGKWRPHDAHVVAAALSSYHSDNASSEVSKTSCLIQHGLFFPEAGPRRSIILPRAPGNGLRVAVLVSGGIAPGINAVIDGIVQRHYLYANPAKYADSERYHNTPSYSVTVQGIVNGFRAFEDPRTAFSFEELVPNPNERSHPSDLVTSEYANQGGSMIGTSRVDDLISGQNRQDLLESMVNRLLASHIDILYVIGGDGSMKAAHAIWSIVQRWNQPNKAKLSVVAIPKTMDNDILWMWQSFGFMSAVERAREVIEHLSTEIKSNPRLCVVQLFGSDSGFVVSHAVLASQTGHCDAALIPEVDFSMQSLARYMKQRMCERQELLPRGMVVMAETAVPIDSLEFLDDKDVDLSGEEKEAIREFEMLRAQGRRIQGQTNDFLRSAGLKIVSRGLQKLIPLVHINTSDVFEPAWSKMRIVVNEPRHMLRAIPPSCTDIIMGQRLGTLAVDSAVAGYTDCMISQWLTEYVLVPLELVVLGRKRIPDSGIFWKSVRAKTGQPTNLF